MSKRIWFHFEAPEDGGGEPPIEDPSVEQVVAEEAWAPSREEWDRQQQFIHAATPILQRVAYDMQQGGGQQQPQYEAPAPAGTTIDPWQPDTIERYVAEQIETGVADAVADVLGPYQPLLGYVATRESEQVARNHLESLHQEAGSFNDDAAYLIAAPMIEAGYDPRVALSTSAQFMAEMEKQIRADERAVVQQELEQLRGAGQQGAGGSGAGVGASEMETVPTGRDRYKVAVQRALDRRQSQFPVG